MAPLDNGGPSCYLVVGLGGHRVTFFKGSISMSGQAPRATTRAAILRKLLRFTARRNKQQCWIWTGALSTGRYGIMRLPGAPAREAPVYVHRLAFELFNGPIPPGHDVHHDCYVKCCWNPAHLHAIPATVHRVANFRLEFGCSLPVRAAALA